MLRSQLSLSASLVLYFFVHGRGKLLGALVMTTATILPLLLQGCTYEPYFDSFVFDWGPNFSAVSSDRIHWVAQSCEHIGITAAMHCMVWMVLDANVTTKSRVATIEVGQETTAVIRPFSNDVKKSKIKVTLKYSLSELDLVDKADDAGIYAREKNSCEPLHGITKVERDNLVLWEVKLLAVAWVRRHPDYNVGLIDCQTFANDIYMKLTDCQHVPTPNSGLLRAAASNVCRFETNLHKNAANVPGALIRFFSILIIGVLAHILLVVWCFIYGAFCILPGILIWSLILAWTAGSTLEC